MNPWKKARAGFTLIELLVVLAILGVLAAAVSFSTDKRPAAVRGATDAVYAAITEARGLARSLGQPVAIETSGIGSSLGFDYAQAKYDAGGALTGLEVGGTLGPLHLRRRCGQLPALRPDRRRWQPVRRRDPFPDPDLRHHRRERQQHRHLQVPGPRRHLGQPSLQERWRQPGAFHLQSRRPAEPALLCGGRGPAERRRQREGTGGHRRCGSPGHHHALLQGTGR
ncbi:MAG: prepilin-type N-terminal cleavage/methylation domain-containing protein [Holophagaceae bacterium]|nr:prepilin-type N-terminal cleavage/methylation domain-containing protein [Holophagaceae bacterium]